MNTAARVLLVASLSALGGCAQLLRWSAPPEHNFPELAKAPEERPMQLIAGDYRVAKGDTLYSIAFRNNIDYHDIARWNGIGRDFRIVPGQVIKLTAPPVDSAVAAAPAPSPATHAHATAAIPPVVAAPAAAPVVAAAEPAVVEPPVELPAGFQWQWPTSGTVLHPYAPSVGAKGLDFTGNIGQPVLAAAPGRVVYSGNALKGYGELIIIKHDEQHLSAYGYNRRRYVVEGDFVTAGQPIGELGLGPENKPLLHFEIRERGKPVNPSQYLPARL